MSSVGFTSNNTTEQELEKLREAIRSLNDVLRTIESAKCCIEVMNFGLAKNNLASAAWHAGEAKKAITTAGQIRTKRPAGKS